VRGLAFRCEVLFYLSCVGRQINLVATRADMALLFDEVRASGGQVAELWDYSPDPVVVSHVAGLTGVILPPPELLLLDRSFHAARGRWVTRELSSQVVMLSVGHTLEGVPRSRPAGRLWFSTILGYDGEEQPIVPDPGYLAWCDALYTWVRRWKAIDGMLYGPEAEAGYRPRPEVVWVLARQAELSYVEAEGAIAQWRRDLGLPESELRVRVADHGGYLDASIHVRSLRT
jgi:hypothetical protein